MSLIATNATNRLAHLGLLGDDHAQEILSHPHLDHLVVIEEMKKLNFILLDKMEHSYQNEMLRLVGSVAQSFFVPATEKDLEGYAIYHLDPGDKWHYEALSAQCLISLAYPGGQISGLELLRIMLSDHPQRWSDQYAEMT